jgi:hypothetical protein
MIWSVIDDFVKNIAKAIFHMLARWYQHVANLAWRPVDADFEESPPKRRDEEV